MNYKRAGALVFVAIMATMPFATMVKAAEEPATPIPFTPAGSAPAYGIFFADNMAFTPQWRIGNQIRIEVAVFKAFDITGDGVVDASSIPVAVNTDMVTGVVYDQATLMADPNLVLSTWMVSVPEIRVTASSATTDDVKVFYSNFADGITEADTVGREINKAGHLIYGLQWDTTGVDAGTYKVSVEIPAAYDVAFPLRSLLTEESADPIGYEVLPADAGVSGTGGLEDPNNAYIYLGVLVAKGGSSGGGGNGPKGR